MPRAAKEVLIVEDEKALAQTLSLKLQAAGFKTTVVETGTGALAAVRERTFKVILLDLILPQMDGFEVLRELQAQGNKIPVIVTSNLGQEQDIERTKALGARSYFVKAKTPLTTIVAEVEKIAKVQ